MAYTERKRENNRKWDQANLDRISVAAPKGTKQRIQAAADAEGESINQYIIGAIEDRLSAWESQDSKEDD